MVSKKASVKEGIDPLSQKGSKPKNENTTHTIETIMHPSLFPINFSAFRLIKAINAPIEIQIKDDMRKEIKSSPPYIKATTEDINIKTPSITKRSPNDLNTMDLLIITEIYECTCYNTNELV